MTSHEELEQVRAINRALPFAEGIAQGNALRRDHLEATFMDRGYDLANLGHCDDPRLEEYLESGTHGSIAVKKAIAQARTSTDGIAVNLIALGLK